MANKVKGAYAACVHDIYQAQRAQLSNNANIITMGSQVIGIELAKCIIKEYLNALLNDNNYRKYGEYILQVFIIILNN